MHLFKKENTQIKSTSILHTFNILQAEFSKEKGKRSNHTAISTNFILYGGKALLDTSVSNNSLRVTTQIVQEIQQIPVIPCRLSSPARRNFILTTKFQQILQEEAHPMPLQHSYAYQADSRAVPSILYGRKSFCTPTVFPGLPVILPVETAF